jgi:carbon starvation protein
LASLLVVAAWGAFLIMGVRDPEGGVKALWPIFGIANQLLASVALCLATTILLKMQLTRVGLGRPAFALITAVPLIWLLAVTGTAAIEKIFHSSPRIGFLAAARAQDEKRPMLEAALRAAPIRTSSAEKALRDNRMIAFNSRVDATVTVVFLVLVGLVVALTAREWVLLLARRKSPRLHETDPTWVPAAVGSRASPLGALGAVTLGMTLLKELSGQAAVEREQATAEACDCAHAQSPRGRQNVYLSAVERRFTGVTRCC